MRNRLARNRKSYWLTTVFAGIVAGASIVTMIVAYEFVPEAYKDTGLLATGLVVVVTGLISISGFVVLNRDKRTAIGREDLLLATNQSRSEFGLREELRTGESVQIPLGRFRRLVGRTRFVVGDVVQIRTEAEIRKTLDSHGRLDELPFMEEMSRFCGQRATIFRCVDKVYDYGGSKTLRRLKDSFLLAMLRCDGANHDGCEAGCYLIWKAAWLKSVDDSSSSVEGAVEVRMREDDSNPACRNTSAGRKRYVCQYTELTRASHAMHTIDPRQDLRPLVAGNITLKAFGIAMLTRLFNFVQDLRRGAPYPAIRPVPSESTPSSANRLMEGEVVRVQSVEQIAKTLNRFGKNRGLWFDREMVKYCGQVFRVDRRVTKIIDDATGEMLEMKTPCIVLEGVDSSGEFLRFCAQHDEPFWRECWLSRI